MRLPYRADWFYVVSPLDRPGARLFCVRLEYEHFPPRTAANDKFNMEIMHVADVDFFVAAVPLACKSLCVALAAELGMFLVKGVPVVVGGGQEWSFPMEGDNVYTLEGRFEGDEHAATQGIFARDVAPMREAFQNHSVIGFGTGIEVQNFLESSLRFNPIIAHLLGGERGRMTDECCFAALDDGRPFGICTVSYERSAIPGLYVLCQARRLGIGRQLFVSALKRLNAHRRAPVYVDLLSIPMKRIVETLPAWARPLVRSRKVDFDLTALEQPFIDAEEWFMEEDDV